ncbi:glycosyl hydrolase family 28 protein [Paenibacillus sp. LPE1-1-1.1]|uniref:glycosyl hydrolase family 28 protein n=1 Tax=Paenibacillus sp. LPE1-1-1.1 TaxID=3135230 RepID=UPI00343B7A4D
MSQVNIYPELRDIPKNGDFEVKIRASGGEWIMLPVYEVKVDMHQVRKASMAYFDLEGPVDVEISCRYTHVETVIMRPLALGIVPEQNGNAISFQIDQPTMLSIEVNDDRFRNLHLFGNALEINVPSLNDEDVKVIKPGIHRQEWLETDASILYFAPGMHYIEETIVRLPSGKTVYIDGGAAVVGSFVCDNVSDITIRGRGMIYLADFHRYSAFRGVRIMHSERITIEGIMTIDTPHYSVYVGGSNHVSIQGLKSFSTRGWSDGIDIMSSSDIRIDGVFMRNSDDCIAIYGSRLEYRGDSRRIQVTNSVLWADVAHPLMIGTHGDYDADGDIIEDIRFENIDILEHHEPQPNYWGAMSINAGDKNIVRNVLYNRIRVESIEMGQLFDIRVVHNPDYNPAPGKRIEQIVFQNVEFAGGTAHPSRIHGFDEERALDGVTFINLRIGGKTVNRINHHSLSVNDFARNISFVNEDKQ